MTAELAEEIEGRKHRKHMISQPVTTEKEKNYYTLIAKKGEASEWRYHRTEKAVTSYKSETA